MKATRWFAKWVRRYNAGQVLLAAKRKVLGDCFDGYMRIYPTFKCNLTCKYCVNTHNPSAFRGMDFSLRSGEMWVNAINKIGRNVIFTGGEPFLHPDFLQILNGIRRDIVVKVYTNFGFDPVRFIEEVERSVVFYGSYHPISGNPLKFIETINTLRNAGRFQGTIHAIKWSGQEKFLDKAQQIFREHGWELLIEDDQFRLFDCASMRFRKKVKCTRRIILIAPNGDRYPCVSKMVRMTGAMENILEGELGDERISLICNDYGYCSPCDGLGETSIRFL